MTTKIKIDELPELDMAQYLDTDEDIAEYLSQVLEDGEPGELAAALGHIAKARGMTEIAKASGIKREALYKALRPDAHPRLDTVQRVCRALGIKLTAKVTNSGEPSSAKSVHQ
jgi:probable addiction module antidote protein